MKARAAAGSRSARSRRSNGAAPRQPAKRWSPARLMAEAGIARRRSYAPYSRFRVGAALLTADGRVIHGCNVENSSFGLSICAERNAVWKAVSEGVTDFVAVAVTAGDSGGAPPCGACRQVLFEFSPEMTVVFRDATGRMRTMALRELLAAPFAMNRRERR